jgi:cysteine desulfurase family protein (TIGR01976 family)
MLPLEVESSPLDLIGRSLPALLDEPLPVQFPGLRADWARFDAPGGTLVHAAVRDAMAAYLGSEWVANAHGPFPATRFSDRLTDWATGRVRELLGAASGELVFGPNMTTLTAMFLRAVAATVGPGDEIVCTELDHEANVVPWTAAAAARGANVRTARIDAGGVLPVEAVTTLLGPRTRWVAVTAASNALGTVPDVPAICAAAHRAGARVYVDGVQSVPHRPTDVGALGCDAFVTSAYKWYGPHAGVLWMDDELAELAVLAEQTPSAGPSVPGRVSLGTASFEAVLGTGVAAQVLLSTDRAELVERERALITRLVTALGEVPGVRVLGPGAGADRVPVVSFQVSGRPAGQVAQRLAGDGIAVWPGTFYATRTIRAVAPDEPSAVRAGIACYTTQREVDALVAAVAAAAR